MSDLTGVVDIAKAVEMFTAVILAVLVGVSNSPVGSFVVGMLKHVFPNADPRKLNAVTSLGLTGVVWGAVVLGRGEQLNSFFEWVLAIAPATTAFITTVFGSALVHIKGNHWGVPVVGYKKPKDNEFNTTTW